MSSAEGTVPRLRPLSLGEILDVSIKICLRHWRTLMKAVLVVVVPVQIVSTALTADYTANYGMGSLDFSPTSTDSAKTLDDLNQYLGGLAISALLQGLAVLLASAACLRAIAQAYLGEPTDWRSSLSYALHRAGPLLWLTLLYFLCLLGGFVLLIAPGIWLYIALAFGMPALLVEGLRGRKALRRSMTLVKGRWWRTCGIIVFGFILSGIVSAIVQGVFYVGIFIEPDNDALVVILSAIAGTVGLAISTPFQAALTTVLYFDLRVRKEAFDLELLANEIGAGVPSAERAAPAPLLPPEEEIDRSGAPYWPPPPGWKPPGSGGSQIDPAENPFAPSPTESPFGAPTTENPFGPPPTENPFGPSRPGSDPPDDDEPPRLPGVPSG